MFAEIARAVGGETDLDRVLALILTHGGEIIGARRLIVCVPDGDALVAFSGSVQPGESQVRLPVNGTLAGEVLASGRPRRATRDLEAERLDQLTPGAQAAILVPLIFRGETLGVLAGIDPRAEAHSFGQEDEQLLLLSVAASAATAIATARTVAAERLRVSHSRRPRRLAAGGRASSTTRRSKG